MHTGCRNTWGVGGGRLLERTIIQTTPQVQTAANRLSGRVYTSLHVTWVQGYTHHRKYGTDCKLSPKLHPTVERIEMILYSEYSPTRTVRPQKNSSDSILIYRPGKGTDALGASTGSGRMGGGGWCKKDRTCNLCCWVLNNLVLSMNESFWLAVRYGL